MTSSRVIDAPPGKVGRGEILVLLVAVALLVVGWHIRRAEEYWRERVDHPERASEEGPPP